MSSDLSLVRRLQELDQQIDSLTREIDGLPGHIRLIETKLAFHRKELAGSEESLAENGKQHRSLEGQVGDFNQKISKLQDQMNSARTNTQFRAFQHEIQFCKDKVDHLEDRILERMEEAESLAEAVERARADLKVESAKVADEVRDARARIEDDKIRRIRLQDERQVLADQVDRPSLGTYEGIRASHGTALAAVVGENCGSCHVRLRPKLLQDLQELQKGLLTCERCRLILYFPDQTAAA